MKIKFKKTLNCIDFTVSKKTFDLLWDEDLDMLITSPQPKDSELGRYYESENYISHTDSKISFFDKVYQIVKGIAVKRKLKLIKSLFKNKGKILDVGCGTGDFLAECKKNSWLVTGIEPNAKAKEIAFHKTGQKIYSNIDELENKNLNDFDIITLWHVLEHIPNLNDYIGKIKAILKLNGYLIIAVPNFKSYDARYYGKFWAAYDVPRHLWHFSQKSIKEIFFKHKFELIATKPMVFDSYYVSLLSEKYKSGSSNPIKAFYRGLVSNIKAKQSGEYSSLIYILKNNNS